ncbi:unnamed protein product [Prunus armeniaca]
MGWAGTHPALCIDPPLTETLFLHRMDLLTKFDVSIINTPPNKDPLRNVSESLDKQCHIPRQNDHFVGSFESKRVLAFWKERYLQLGDEIQKARAHLEFVEGQIKDNKRQANLDRAKLQRMKRRHKRLRSVAIQKYKNSSNALESKKRVMQAGFNYFRSYAKLVVPGFDWSSITVSDVNKYTQQGSRV